MIRHLFITAALCLAIPTTPMDVRADPPSAQQRWEELSNRPLNRGIC